MRHMLVLLVAALWASPVQAEIKWPELAFGTAVTADYISTYRGYYRGNIEVGIPGRWLQDSPWSMIAFTAGVDATTLALAAKWVKPKHRKIYTVGVYGLAAFRSYLAIRNERLNRGGTLYRYGRSN